MFVFWWFLTVCFADRRMGRGVQCPREAAGAAPRVSLAARLLVILYDATSPINLFSCHLMKKNHNIFNCIPPRKCFAYFIILFHERGWGLMNVDQRCLWAYFPKQATSTNTEKNNQGKACSALNKIYVFSLATMRKVREGRTCMHRVSDLCNYSCQGKSEWQNESHGKKYAFL